MDIVERLRNKAAMIGDGSHGQKLLLEAADQIERLRAENSHLHHQTNKLGGDVLRLRAEVAAVQLLAQDSITDADRLRELLREAHEYMTEQPWELQQRIDAALGGEGKDERR